MADDASGQVLRVLVVDDERVSRTWVAGLVRRCGYEALQVDSGEAALELFSREQVDIVLMDAVMPGIGGFEAAARIKAGAGARWVPVIFLSGLDERDSRARWIDVGDDFLTKPLDAQLLRARLRSMQMAIAYEQQLRRRTEELMHEQQLAQHMMNRISYQDELDAFDWIETRSEAADISSGDCLVVEEGAEGCHVLVADAMGHGLAAAVTLLPAINVFHAMARKGFEPVQIAREINQKLRSMLPRERFISAAIIQIDRRARQLRVWNGGLPGGCLVTADGELRQRFPSIAPPLGVLDDEQFEASAAASAWEAGDRLLLWTDGFRESFDIDPLAMPAVVAEHFRRSGADGAVASLWAASRAQPTGDDASLIMLRLQPIVASEAQRADRPQEPCLAGEVLARLTLMPAQLRRSPDGESVLRALESLGLAGCGSPRLALILSELLANALDHGLLQLDSALKNRGSEGFDAYFRLREERLAALVEGWVDIEIRRGASAHTCVVDVRDSGAGFDVRHESQSGEAQTAAAGGGRGLQLLRHLCLRLEHLEGGTRALATVSLGETQETNDGTTMNEGWTGMEPGACATPTEAACKA